MIFDISFKAKAKGEDGRRVQDLSQLLHENGWIVEGSFNFREEGLGEKTVFIDGFYETPHNAAILTLQKSIGSPQSGDYKIHDLINDLWALIEKYDIDDLTQIRDILILEELKDGPIKDEPQTLAALYLYARGLYGDPSVRFDVLHKEVTERFMKLMKTDVPLCPKLTALYEGAKEQYDESTTSFDNPQLHTFVCQNFVDIMSQEAD